MAPKADCESRSLFISVFEPVDPLICGLFVFGLHGFEQPDALLGMGAEGCK